MGTNVTGTAADGRNERHGEEELATIGGASDVFCMVVVVVDGDENPWRRTGKREMCSHMIRFGG
jgi:hypothetical protein